MGKLLTAPAHASTGDYGHSDQDEMLCPDTKFLCLVHPPFVCVEPDSEGSLWGLKPPDSLIRDWNKEIISVEKYYPEVWEEVDYENRYREHLRTDSDAQSDMFTISATANGSDVCLLCQDEFYDFCIRRIVFEYMHDNGEL